MKALVVPPALEEQLQLVDIGKEDLDAYRRLVAGDIEVVTFTTPPGCMYLNENGKDMGLPINRRATCLLWVHNSAFRNRDYIVGQTFIVGPPDDDGYDTDVPAELVELLTKPGRFRYEVQADSSGRWAGNALVFDDWYSAYTNGLDLADRWVLVSGVRVVRASE